MMTATHAASTVYNGVLWITGGSALATGDLLRWTAAAGWAFDNVSSPVSLGLHAPHARIASKWFIGWGDGAPSTSIYEIDLAAPGTKTWRLVTSLAGVVAARHWNAGLTTTLGPITAEAGAVLGACGDLLLWVGDGYRPLFIDPTTGGLVASELNAAVSGPAYSLRYAASGSDSFTCTTFAVGGLNSSSAATSFAVRINGSHPAGASAAAGVAEVLVYDVQSRNATVLVRYRYNGDVAIARASVSCAPASGGPSHWGAVATPSANEGWSVLIAVGLVPNTTYVCRANATSSGTTSSNAASAPFLMLREPPAAPSVAATGVRPRNATILVSYGFAGGDLIVSAAASCAPAGNTSAEVWSASAPSAPDATSATFDVVGLTPNTTYVCSANTTTRVGTSQNFASPAFVTTAEPPDPPRTVSMFDVTARSANVTAFFGGNGGGWITSASARCAPAVAAAGASEGSGYGSVAAPEVATSVTFGVYGMTPNTSYTCSVVLRNSGGNSSSNASEPFSTGAEPPAPPASVVISAIHPRNATVRIVLGYSGGAWITSVAASCTSGSGGSGPLVWTGSSPVAAGTSTWSFLATGLLPNATYFCSANSSNAQGTSRANASAPFLTAAEAPAAPSAVTVSSIRRDQALLKATFGYNGGSWITGVSASCVLAGAGTAAWSGAVPALPGDEAATIDVTGLSAGTVYVCSASVINAAGESPRAATAPFTTAPAPTPTPMLLSVVEVVAYNPSVVPDGAALVSRIAAYTSYPIAPVLLKDEPVAEGGSASASPARRLAQRGSGSLGGASVRSRKAEATISFTFLSSYAQNSVTFYSLLRSLPGTSPTLVGIYEVYLQGSELQARANVAYPFLGAPLDKNVLARLTYDPEIERFSRVAEAIRDVTGHLPSAMSVQARTGRPARALLQFAQETAVVDFGSSTGALAAARKTLEMVSRGHIEAVYSLTLEIDGSTATNPRLTASTDAVPIPTITQPAGRASLALDPNGTAGPGAAFAFLSAGAGSAFSGLGLGLGLAATRKPVVARLLAVGAPGANSNGTAGAAGVRSVLVSRTGEAACALSDGAETLFFAMNGAEGDVTFVAMNASSGANRTLSAADLPGPSACALVAGPGPGPMPPPSS
eukprot:tig00021717_g23140.t1